MCVRPERTASFVWTMQLFTRGFTAARLLVSVFHSVNSPQSQCAASFAMHNVMKLNDESTIAFALGA